MRITFSILALSAIFIILTASCSDHKSTKREAPAITDITATFLAIFQDIDPEGLHVYSPCDTTDGHKFTGRVIAQRFHHYFSFDKAFTETIQSFSKDTLSHIYSCFKFPLSDSRTGLLVRWPSQYDESAIYLFTWDNKLKKMIAGENIADTFGDEGWYFIQDAWLTDINKDKKLDIVIHRMDHDQDIEDSTKAPAIKDSLAVLLADGKAGFIPARVNLDSSRFRILNWDGK